MSPGCGGREFASGVAQHLVKKSHSVLPAELPILPLGRGRGRDHGCFVVPAVSATASLLAAGTIVALSLSARCRAAWTAPAGCGRDPAAVQPAGQHRARQLGLAPVRRCGPGRRGRRTDGRLGAALGALPIDQQVLDRGQRGAHRSRSAPHRLHHQPARRRGAGGCQRRGRPGVPDDSDRRRADHLRGSGLGRHAVRPRVRLLLDVRRRLGRVDGRHRQRGVQSALARRLLGAPRHHPARVRQLPLGPAGALHGRGPTRCLHRRARREFVWRTRPTSSGTWGQVSNLVSSSNIVGVAPLPNGTGYWEVEANGKVGNFGAAPERRLAQRRRSTHPSSASRRRPTAAATGWSPLTVASSASATPTSTARPARCA